MTMRALRVIAMRGRAGMMREILLDIWSKIPTFMIFVADDIDGALFLVDRIVVMSSKAAASHWRGSAR
jgi:ABC-type taurine transport system ATPase subunit